MTFDKDSPSSMPEAWGKYIHTGNSCTSTVTCSKKIHIFESNPQIHNDHSSASSTFPLFPLAHSYFNTRYTLNHGYKNSNTIDVTSSSPPPLHIPLCHPTHAHHPRRRGPALQIHIPTTFPSLRAKMATLETVQASDSRSTLDESEDISRGKSAGEV